MFCITKQITHASCGRNGKVFSQVKSSSFLMQYDIRTLLHERRKLEKKTLETWQTTVITHVDTKNNEDIKSNQSSESKQTSIDNCFCTVKNWI